MTNASRPMRHRRILVPALAILAMTMLAACSASSADPEALMNKTFTTQEVTIDGTKQALALGSTLTLTFTADGISAKADCNSMFGQVNLDGGSLQMVTPLGMTMMACDPALMDQDQWISDFLSSGPNWSLDGSTLMLTSGKSSIELRDATSA